MLFYPNFQILKGTEDYTQAVIIDCALSYHFQRNLTPKFLEPQSLKFFHCENGDVIEMINQLPRIVGCAHQVFDDRERFDFCDQSGKAFTYEHKYDPYPGKAPRTTTLAFIEQDRSSESFTLPGSQARQELFSYQQICGVASEEDALKRIQNSFIAQVNGKFIL